MVHLEMKTVFTITFPMPYVHSSRASRPFPSDLSRADPHIVTPAEDEDCLELENVTALALSCRMTPEAQNCIVAAARSQMSS